MSQKRVPHQRKHRSVVAKTPEMKGKSKSLFILHLLRGNARITHTRLASVPCDLCHFCVNISSGPLAHTIFNQKCQCVYHIIQLQFDRHKFILPPVNVFSSFQHNDSLRMNCEKFGDKHGLVVRSDAFEENFNEPQ